MKRTVAFVCALILVFVCSCSKKTKVQNIEYDMTQYADDVTALYNPDKGWYVHYYDNGLSKYGVGSTPQQLMAALPCLDHIYLRLAWGYLEPQEGQFDWEVIDKVIDPFVEAGIGISFRITCKETDGSFLYATPEWVRLAGAQGTMLSNAWEPDYGDSIFLEKLRNFHTAFAERYGGKDYVRYVDIGSYGDWGEGHTSSSSQKTWGYDVIKKHFDIYSDCYPNDLIVVNDDFIGGRSSYIERTKILEYVLEHNWTFRDDSVSVKWYAETFGYDTLRSPELFDKVWQSQPTVLELQHYNSAVSEGNWKDGAPFYQAAIRTHSTYAGFHGYPISWAQENSEFAVKMGNKLGYWYFVDKVVANQNGNNLKILIDWRNCGMSKAYNRYDLKIILTDKEGKDYEFYAENFDNTALMPDVPVTTEHQFDIKSVKSGEYTLSVRLDKGEDISVLMAVDSQHTGEDGRCIVGNIEI